MNIASQIISHKSNLNRYDPDSQDAGNMSIVQATLICDKYLQMTKDDLNLDTGFRAELVTALRVLMHETQSLMPILGHLLHIRRAPITKDMAPMFHSLFNLVVPPRMLLRYARQIGKSTSMAGKTIIMSSTNPEFKTLTVTPQYEITRKYSANVVKPLLEYSPISSHVLDTSCERNVLQRTLANRSMLFFGYAADVQGADRIRGVSADRTHYDEVQDMDPDVIPIVSSTMDRSKWRLEDFSGTPKTLDNLQDILWARSSQAEWLIPCGCGYTNVPTTEADLGKMMVTTGLSCAKCGKLVNACAGYWKHFNPSKAIEFPGYHLSQPIMPFHYENKRNWKELMDAVEGKAHISIAELKNEKFGESCDVGQKLVTKTDLIRASRPEMSMEYNKARARAKHFMIVAMGVDWGGRGVTGESLTKVSIIGMHPDGKVDVLYGEVLSALGDEAAEVARTITIFMDFGCALYSHDAGGSGGMRDILLVQRGFPANRIMPFMYTSSWVNSVVTFHAATLDRPRDYWALDKSRSLALQAQLIKTQWIRFPRWEESEELLSDYLALIEEKSESRTRGDLYLIRRQPGLSDDFAHATNFACAALFHTQDNWPRLYETDKYRLSLEDARSIDPWQVGDATNVKEWDKEDKMPTVNADGDEILE